MLLGAMLVVQLLFALAVVLVAAYERPDSGMTYTTPLASGTLLSKVSALTFDGVWRGRSASDGVFLVSSWLAILTLLLTFRQSRSRLRSAVFALQCVVLFWGWVGLWMLPFDLSCILRGTMDCEWIAESSPIYEVVGLWLAVSATGAVMSFDVPPWSIRQMLTTRSSQSY